MVKKYSIIFLTIFSFIILTSCSNPNKLLILNWGEYIDESLIEIFEEEYNCQVVMDLGESNEIFYSKLRSGTTCYDIVVPSDYMVKKMYENDMLAEIDFSKIPNFDEDNLMPKIKDIADTLETTSSGISNYYVPYLWGTWGIMYNSSNEELTNVVTNSSNSWSSLFDRNILPEGTRVAMYDSYLHAYYASCRYLGLSTKDELSGDELLKIYNLIDNMNYDAWGTDDIKKDIVAKNKDLGFMWAGDFLYYYCETLANMIIDAYSKNDIDYSNINEMINTLVAGEKYMDKYVSHIDLFIPDDTISFCDNFVISKDAMHYDLALEFINFMLSREEVYNDPSFSNTYYVSYNSPYVDVYEDIVNLSDVTFDQNDKAIYDEEIKHLDVYSTSLYSKIYNSLMGFAFEKYYPADSLKGNILSSFDRKYINKINQTFNDARS